MSRQFVIGTRGSKLALVQAHLIQNRLAETYPEHTFIIQTVQTTGDRVQDRPLNQIGDKGVFVREIEEQLLDGALDIGVHSMKDMPALPADGLLFTRPWKREDPRDVLILREKKDLSELPAGAVIGTGSPRRKFQLLRLRPDLSVVDIRGNVDTRLRKMEEEKLDGIVLAAAGMHRLGMQDRITCYLEPGQMVPAPAQGVLALEIRKDDEELCHLLDALGDEETAGAAAAERNFLQAMGGDCHMPVGAVCEKTGPEEYRLRAMFGSADGKKLAFSETAGSIPAELAKEAARRIRQQLSGLVSLVGAGPGDPGLITEKGLRAIRQADCIVYDRLACPTLLGHASPSCEKIYVGKASRHHTMKQEDINRLLIRKSMEYNRVVRLKGGDNYVFGRGGEEGLSLWEHGVPFEVIPGISSALAGPAYAGIPVTHRGIASGFHVVTAHSHRDELADIDFHAMARGTDTCVFLMGLDKVAQIAKKLLAAGMPADTGAALISHATTLQQKTLVSDLRHLAEKASRACLPSPALIVVGNVVKLRDSLNFFENRPLFGRRYLLPCIGPNPSVLAGLLREKGAAMDEVTVGTIRTCRAELTEELLQKTDWLLFTSKNGVEHFFANLRDARLDIRHLGGCRIAAIGGKTAGSLQQHGLYADLIPDTWNSGALALALKNILSADEHVLYLRGKDGQGSLKEILSGRCHYEERAVYENAEAAEIVLPGSPSQETPSPKPPLYDGILFTCASSARRLNRAAKETVAMNRQRLYSIGPKTTTALAALGFFDVKEAEEASYEDMVKMLLPPSSAGGHL